MLIPFAVVPDPPLQPEIDTDPSVMVDPKVSVPVDPVARAAVIETPCAAPPVALLFPLILIGPVLVIPFAVTSIKTPGPPPAPPADEPAMLIVPLPAETKRSMATPAPPVVAVVVLWQSPMRMIFPVPLVEKLPEAVPIKIPQIEPVVPALDAVMVMSLPPREVTVLFV